MDLAYVGNLADRLDAVRAERIAADKVARKLKSEEEALKQELILLMESADLSSAGGKNAVVTRSVKKRAQAEDWAGIQGYILEHEAFDLLERRLRTPPVLLRLDDGVNVPGIYIHEYSHLTYGKART